MNERSIMWLCECVGAGSISDACKVISFSLEKKQTSVHFFVLFLLLAGEFSANSVELATASTMRQDRGER